MSDALSTDLAAAAERIKLRLMRAADDVVFVGQELLTVRNGIGEGQFLEWIDAEFGMSRATAYRFISVAERFGNDFDAVRSLSPSVLYELAAPSTPPEVREEATERATKGEKITAAEVRRLKARAAQADEFEADKAKLEKSAKLLSRQVSDLTGQLQKASEPRVVVQPDLAAEEREYLNCWRTFQAMPPHSRERFHAELMRVGAFGRPDFGTIDPVAETIDGDGALYSDEGGADDLAVADEMTENSGKKARPFSAPADDDAADLSDESEDRRSNQTSGRRGGGGGRSQGGTGTRDAPTGEGAGGGDGPADAQTRTPEAAGDDDPFHDLTFHRQPRPKLPAVDVERMRRLSALELPRGFDRRPG